MAVNAYLNFNGRCEEAFKYYEKALGARIESLTTFAGTPMEAQVPADWKHKIIHGRIEIAGTVVMASDATPDRYSKPQGFAVSVTVASPAEAQRFFKALSEGGAVGMPLMPTFWAERFGMCTDKFGIPWMVNCEKAQGH